MHGTFPTRRVLGWLSRPVLALFLAAPAGCSQFIGTTASYFDIIHKLGGPAVNGFYSTCTINYPYDDDPSKEVRDFIIASGMEHGMRESMDQLDELAATLAQSEGRVAK